MRVSESKLFPPPKLATLVAVILFCPLAGMAQNEGDLFNFYPFSGFFGGSDVSICVRTAHVAAYVCRREVNVDAFVDAAIANNIGDAEERGEELHERAVDRARTARECTEQLEARLELCDRLDESRYDPDFDPENFGPVTVPNPYFPLVPGTVFVYEGDTEEGTERNVVTVTDETREILGVEATIVLDQVFVEDELTEDTRDYFAQDLDGNVWYLGEDTLEIQEDGIQNIDGSWRAGVEGAKPGLIMRANPTVGDAYRQEFSLGEAEDAAATLSLDENVSVPFGDLTNCLMTEEFTPIEPDAREYKYYAPGIGFVLAVDVETGRRLELVELTAPLTQAGGAKGLKR